MDLGSLGSALYASGVLPLAYVLGSLALLAGVAISLSGPRPRSPTRRAAGAILGAFGLALALPSLVLGIAAVSSPSATPSPTIDLTEGIISCSTSGILPPIPAAPPPGCILLIEWGDPGRSPTGLLATTQVLEPTTRERGRWCYCSPEEARQRIQAFRERYPSLPVDDRR